MLINNHYTLRYLGAQLFLHRSNNEDHQGDYYYYENRKPHDCYSPMQLNQARKQFYRS